MGVGEVAATARRREQDVSFTVSCVLWMYHLCPPYVLVTTLGAFRNICVFPLLCGRCKRSRLHFYTQRVQNFALAGLYSLSRETLHFLHQPPAVSEDEGVQKLTL